MDNARRPSLINALLWTGLGILFLLSNLDIIPDMWTLCRQYWPFLLIVLGAGKVIDYFLRKDTVSLRIGEFFGILILLIAGIFLTKISENHWTQFFRSFPFTIGNISIHPEQWIGDSHTFNEEALFPLDGNTPIRIENSNGSVSVAAGNEREVRVLLKKVVYADASRAGALAGKIHVKGESEPPASGIGKTGGPGSSRSVFVVKTNRDSLDTGNFRVDTDLEVFVPKESHLQVRNVFGSVRASGLGGKLDLSTTHRPLEVRDCKGEFTISSRYGECRLSDLVGNLSLESRSRVYLDNFKGDVNVTNEFSPTVITNVDGKVTVSCSEGELRIEDVSRPVVVDARGSGIKVAGLESSLKIVASHRDVHVEDIASDVSIESRYADVFLESVRGDVDIQSHSDRIRAEDIDGGITVRGRGSGIRVDDSDGNLNIRTTLKDVAVNGFSGSCNIENAYAGVRLSMRSLDGNDVNIKNRNGGIDLHLPDRADFSINAVARQGKVESFYAGLVAPVHAGSIWTLESESTAPGAKIRLETEYGDIRIFGSRGNRGDR